MGGIEAPSAGSRQADVRDPGRFGPAEDRWVALRRRDPAADGHFFYSVRTTGVYCYPSCAARTARAENVEFHDTREAAELAGFRPCRRCRPDLPTRREREAQLIVRSCRIIERTEEPLTLVELARAVGCSPHHFHRLFRRITGITPKAYADAHRHDRVRAGLADGERVTDTVYDAGFSSSGRFYAVADEMLGMTPTAYRTGGGGEVIQYATGTSSLGKVLVASSTRGICAILLGDAAEALIADLAARFPKAVRQPADRAFARIVDEVVDLMDHPAEASALSLPLDIRGTAFQRRVWEALRVIPAGETVSYSEVAARIGRPQGSRAVAAACAANTLAVAVPCHRVVAKDGTLAGYRWGRDRKRTLLDREKA